MASRVFIVQLFVRFDRLEYFHSKMSRRKNKTHNPLRTKCPFSAALPLPFTLASPGNRFMRLKQQERFTCPLTQEINPKMLTGLERLCLQSPLGNLPLERWALSWGSGGLGALLGGWWPSAPAPTGARRKALTSPSPYRGGPGSQHPTRDPLPVSGEPATWGPSDPSAGWGGPGASSVPSLRTPGHDAGRDTVLLEGTEAFLGLGKGLETHPESPSSSPLFSEA